MADSISETIIWLRINAKLQFNPIGIRIARVIGLPFVPNGLLFFSYINSTGERMVGLP
jgi:hypothetical protein